MAARAKKEWTVYIIETENGFLYTGITKDFERRWGEHQSSPKSAKFFRRSPPKKVRLSVEGFTQSMALRIEWAVKKLSRESKEKLIRKADAKAMQQLLKAK